MEARAAEHDKLAGDLVAQVADPLRVVAGRFEEIRRRHVEYADKLEKERDAVYGELRKTKGKYDTTCQEVENRRKKAESAFDYSKAKAQNAYQQQTLDMHNAKNTYLIGINIANKQKEKYYHETVPDLMDSLQDLAETRTDKLNSIWLVAARLEHNTLKANMDHVDHVMLEIPRNLPNLDSIMYIRHNLVQWQEPPNKVFEPSPVWHDDDAMIIDDSAKIFLRNVLSKSKAQLGDLRREVDMKRREVDANQRIKQQIREGKDNRDEVEVVKAVFASKEQLHDIDHKRLTAEVETLTITGVVGDVTFGAKSHNFKSQTFKIPTNCDLCGERIWGLSAKGFDCRDCGYTCHSKCEMKVPAECPGEQSKEDRKKLKAERQEVANTMKAPPTTGQMAPPDGAHELSSVSRSNTMNSLSSRYNAEAQRSVSGRGTPDEDGSTAAGFGSTVVHTMDSSTSLKPMAAPAARKNRVVAPPPSAYISELPGSVDQPSSMPTSIETRGKMLYSYDANEPGEITVPEGREVTIVEPDGMSPFTYAYLMLTKFRWWVDEGASRLQGGRCPNSLSRGASSLITFLRDGTTGTSLIDILEFRIITFEQRGWQEARTGCGSTTWSQEVAIC